MLTWTHIDQQEAMSDGWLIANVDGTGLLEIQRYDEANPALRFENDAAAQAHVRLLADCGNVFEIRARACVAANPYVRP